MDHERDADITSLVAPDILRRNRVDWFTVPTAVAFGVGVFVGRTSADWRWWRKFFGGWRTDRRTSSSELEALRQRVRELEEDADRG